MLPNTRTSWRQFYDQQSPLTSTELYESTELMLSIRKLVMASVNTSIDLLSNKLATFASEKMIRIDRSSPEYAILGKIQRNPRAAASQLLLKAVTERPVDLKT